MSIKKKKKFLSRYHLEQGDMFIRTVIIMLFAVSVCETDIETLVQMLRPSLYNPKQLDADDQSSCG